MRIPKREAEKHIPFYGTLMKLQLYIETTCSNFYIEESWLLKIEQDETSGRAFASGNIRAQNEEMLDRGLDCLLLALQNSRGGKLQLSGDCGIKSRQSKHD